MENKIVLGKWNNILDKIFFISFYIITLGVVFYFSLLGCDNHHEGIVFKNTLDILTNKHLYSESFTQYGCIQVWIAAVFCKLFGLHMWVVDLAAACFYAGFFSVIVLILKMYIPRVIAYLITFNCLLFCEFFYGDFLAWTNIYCIFFLALSLYLVLRFLREKKETYIVGVSIISALCLWTKISIGVVLIMGAIMFLSFYVIRYKKKILLLEFIAIILFLSSIFTTYFIINKSFSSMMDQCVNNAIYFAQNYSGTLGPSKFVYSDNNSIINLFVFLKKIIYVLLHPYVGYISLYYLVICINIILFVFEFVLFLRKNNDFNFEYMALTIWSLISWSQCIPVNEFRHNCWAMLLMIANTTIILYVFNSFIIDKFSIRIIGAKYIWFLIVVIFLIGPVMENVYYAKERIENNKIKVENSILEYKMLSEQEATFYNRFEESLITLKNIYPNKNFYNLSYLNLLSCYEGFVSYNEYYSNYGLTGFGNDEIELDFIKNLLEQLNYPILYTDRNINFSEFGYEEYDVIYVSIEDLASYDFNFRLYIWIPQN